MKHFPSAMDGVVGCVNAFDVAVRTFRQSRYRSEQDEILQVLDEALEFAEQLKRELAQMTNLRDYQIVLREALRSDLGVASNQRDYHEHQAKKKDIEIADLKRQLAALA